MQHVTAEGTALVKQAEDAASNKKVCGIFFFGVVISPALCMEECHLEF